MARTPKIACDSCGHTFGIGVPLCGACGRPTAWATHQERTEWEVQQWRKRRPGSIAGPGASIADLPRNSTPRSSAETPVPDAWDGFLTPAEHSPRPARDPRGGPTIVALLRQALLRLRRLFGASMMVPLDSKPAPAQEERDAASHEQAPRPEAPPRMSLVPAAAERIDSPSPAEGTKSATPARKAPANPRKRPAAPTNKDMLKQTLSVLTKVEQRLEQLEQEVAGIDSAVRRNSSVEDSAAVGE